MKFTVDFGGKTIPFLDIKLELDGNTRHAFTVKLYVNLYGNLYS